MPFKDHFQTLRVPHRATSQQIQKAYYERLKFFHPDFFEGDAARHAVAEMETKCLNEAYEALATPAAREAYVREWERHHNPLRAPGQRIAPAADAAGGSGDLATARQQARELQVLLEERTRELKSANLGVRQGQDRLLQLQRTVESQQVIARKLESRLLEREVELQEARNRDGASQTRVRRLERQLADALRQTAAAQLDPMGADGEGPAAAAREATWPAPPVESRDGLPFVSNAGETRELGGNDGQLAEQQRLLDDAAMQIRVLRDRLQSAEQELRLRDGQNRQSGQRQEAAASGAPSGEVQALRSALSERTEDVVRARRQIAEMEERLRDGENAIAQAAARSQSSQAAAQGGRFTRTVDGAAGWLSPSRATVVLTILLIAICAVAISLIFLTVSFDLNSLRTGLGRLGL